VVWLDQCREYFTIYRVPKSIWVLVASLNLEGITSQWWKSYKLRNGIEGWQEFEGTVTDKFGATTYPKALRRLMSLKQTESLAVYILQFEQARYGVTVHNPQYDETYFVTQFVMGLKFEIQSVVEVQLPSTVDRDILLAQTQQEVLERGKMKVTRPYVGGKMLNTGVRGEGRALIGGADLSKERQIREFRKLNGLCYACGDKFKPDHLAKCTKRGQAQLNMVVTEEDSTVLTDEVLQQLEQEDEKEEICCKVSLQAMVGKDNENNMVISATMSKQTLVMLIDSGSSSNFISAHMVHQLELVEVVCSPVKVKVANGETMVCDRMVRGVEWCSQGFSFCTDMRVLPLSAFDVILGYE
jgi:hypothetical protein